MRSRKLILFVAVLLVVCSAVSLAETKKLTRIGINTFAQVRGNIPTAQVMKTIAEKYAADIKYGFDQVGMGNLYLPFLDQLNAGAVTDKLIPVGDKFYWMLFRVKGKVKVWEDVEWAGKQPLPVFAITAHKDDKDYEFIIPKPCGNIALYRVAEAKIAPPPPVCSLVVSPAKANINDVITVDMSGTQNAASMDVEVLTAQGTKVASHAFTPASPRWQTKFDKPGEYVFRAKAVNAEGKVSENPCQGKTIINAPPICKLQTSCLPCEDYVGKPIVFDASGSTDADGQIVKASFEITDETGKVIDSFMDAEKPFTWEKVFAKAGTYGANVVVFDDMGAPSASSDPCRITLEVTQKKLFFLAEAGGLLARGTYTGFIFGRLGMLWNLSPDLLDLIVRFGVALPTQGEPWKTFVMGDVLANIHLGPAVYVDAGLGYTGKEQTERKSGLDLIGAFGVNVFENYGKAGSIFAEVRLPVITKDRDSSNHHKLFLGFRYIF